MKIHIDHLELSCIIGLLDFEREREQQVILDIDADYHYTQASFIDYSRIVTLVTADLKSSKYLLLEEALLGIRDLLFQTFPQIQKLSVRISKPAIIPHCSVALSESWINTPQ